MTLGSLNLATLRSQARLKSSVKIADFSNANLDTQLNIAYLQLAYLLANLEEDYFEEQRSTFNLIQNSGLYSLPPDCIAVKQIRLAFTTPLTDGDYRIAQSYDPTEVHDVGSDEVNVPTANPIVDITNNYFRVKPKPAGNVTSGGQIYYIAMPSALAATADVPVIPIAYQDLIAEYGAAQMAFKYEKWKKHDRAIAIWDKKIAELTQTLADRDRNKVVRFKSINELAGTQSGTRRELPSTW